MEYVMSTLMSAWRTWSLGKNIFPFITRKKQSQANTEEQRGGREKANWGSYTFFFTSFELLTQIIHPCIYLNSKKDLDIPAQNPSGEKVVQESSNPGFSTNQGIRPKCKHGLPVRWNFLYKECFIFNPKYGIWFIYIRFHKFFVSIILGVYSGWYHGHYVCEKRNLHCKILN